jgi:hypothetical protein
MSIRTSVLAALTWMLITGGIAHAEDGAPEGAAPEDAAEDAPAEELARNVVRSVRRSIALGPTLGAFSAYAPSASELDAGISFGLELELFRSAIPTPARVRELAREKTQEKLARIIRDRFAGQRPDPATMQQLVREIAAEVKAEVLAALGAKPRRLERPRLVIPVEASYFFGPADWLGRLGFGFGAGPLSIGPTFSVRFGDDTVARLGAELSIHLLPSGSPRSPVLDVFLRGDFELHARDVNDDQIALGVRVLIDVI